MTTFDTQATAKAKPPRAARKAVPNPYSRANILRRKVENLGLQIVLLAAFFALWEYAADRWVEKIMVSSPSDIWQVVTRWAQDGTYATNLAVTLEATVGGFVLGAVLGMGVGFLTGLWKRLGEVLQPILMALYTLPRLALAPLFLMWFGLGMEFRVVFAATIVFFLVYYNTFFGVREVSRDLINAVRIMGAGRFQVLVRVIVPSALVWVAAGLKISVPYALVGQAALVRVFCHAPRSRPSQWLVHSVRHAARSTLFPARRFPAQRAHRQQSDQPVENQRHHQQPEDRRKGLRR